MPRFFKKLLFMRHAQRLGRCFPIVLMSLGLSACDQGNKDNLDRYIQKVKQSPGGEVTPLPTYHPVKSHAYSLESRRSPFHPAEIHLTDRFQPDLDRPKEPLESYSLDALKMVGTLNRNGRIWALIEAPDGKVLPMRQGNYIGKNYGKITVITRKGIKLEETVRGPNGWEKRETALVLTPSR